MVEISLTGATLGSMRLDWAGTGSTNSDAEGLTYLGNGDLVMVDERPQRAYRFSYGAGSTLGLGDTPYATISNWSPSNIGIEGISVDPRNGSFVTVKQAADNNLARGPQEVRAGALQFAAGGGSNGLPILFDAPLLGLASLSDVQVLSVVDALAGQAAADNLLFLSADARQLVESDRNGRVLSRLDLSAVTPQALEGLTIDELGTLYLVAEDSGFGASRLFVLTPTAPIPEPGTWALMAAGLGLLGWRARHRV